MSSETSDLEFTTSAEEPQNSGITCAKVYFEYMKHTKTWVCTAPQPTKAVLFDTIRKHGDDVRHDTFIPRLGMNIGLYAAIEEAARPVRQRKPRKSTTMIGAPPSD